METRGPRGAACTEVGVVITELDSSSGSLPAMGRETGTAPGGEDEDRVGFVCVEDRKHLELLKC